MVIVSSVFILTGRQEPSLVRLCVPLVMGLSFSGERCLPTEPERPASVIIVREQLEIVPSKPFVVTLYTVLPSITDTDSFPSKPSSPSERVGTRSCLLSPSFFVVWVRMVQVTWIHLVRFNILTLVAPLSRP